MDAELKRLVALAEAEEAYIAAKRKHKRGTKPYDDAKAKFSRLRYEFRLDREEKQREARELAEGTAVAQSVNAKVKREQG